MNNKLITIPPERTIEKQLRDAIIDNDNLCLNLVFRSTILYINIYLKSFGNYIERE